MVCSQAQLRLHYVSPIRVHGQPYHVNVNPPVSFMCARNFTAFRSGLKMMAEHAHDLQVSRTVDPPNPQPNALP